MVDSVDTGFGSFVAAKASIVLAISGSAGGVAISRPWRPTQRSRKWLFEPACVLKLSSEWARNVAGTGASGPSCERAVE